MDSSDFSKRREEDEDIRFFREEYPDTYHSESISMKMGYVPPLPNCLL